MISESTMNDLYAGIKAELSSLFILRMAALAKQAFQENITKQHL